MEKGADLGGHGNVVEESMLDGMLIKRPVEMLVFSHGLKRST